MALTSVRVQNGLTEDQWGSAKVMARDVTFDTSYDTGGETLAASAFGLKTLTGAVIIGGNAASAGYSIRYVTSTGKLIVYYGDYDNAGDGPFIEVPATTNLSTVTVRVLGIGWV